MPYDDRKYRDKEKPYDHVPYRWSVLNKTVTFNNRGIMISLVALTRGELTGVGQSLSAPPHVLSHTNDVRLPILIGTVAQFYSHRNKHMACLVA